MSARRLRRGDLLPRVVKAPPGPRSRSLSRQSDRWEAPGVNTLPRRGGVSLVWREALGANVLDVDGNRYIDLTAGFGVAAVGHRHPLVVAAIRQQSERLLHGLGDVNSHPERIALARRLARLAPVRSPRVYFAVSGSDAIEIALKTATLATGHAGILAFDPAYHGLTLGSLQATSRPAFREPFREHFHAHLHRLPFGAPRAEVRALMRAAGDIGCVLVEPIIGREGILLPPDGWLQMLREVCDERGALFIADEIFTGFGRTGRWFAAEHSGVFPDLICCGKALGGGLPIAAVIGREDILEAWDLPGEALHTATFLAHPVACRAALAVLDILAAERLPGRARRLGSVVSEQLAVWPQRFASVIACRGLGLMWGIELRDAQFAGTLTRTLMQDGLLALAGGVQGNVLQLVPPLMISERQLLCALRLIAAALQRLQ